MSKTTENANHIVQWIKDYATKANRQSLVLGVSGGVDSGLVATLCAMTGIRTIVVSMPCESNHENTNKANLMIAWLVNRFPNVESTTVNLEAALNGFTRELPEQYDSKLGFANTKSRLRMVTLYQIATAKMGLVVGTGNKVEDFGVGFFTKYGDGGVDISPIGDLLKSEVRQMTRELGVPTEICEAVPNDGLWTDDRTDEQQIGATYDELEWAMNWMEDGKDCYSTVLVEGLTPRQKEVLAVYNRWHNAGAHKMAPIPICTLPK